MSPAPAISLKIDQPPQTLRSMVLDRMREAILTGYFKSGQRLVERPLCDELGVSRTVVRETIRYLEAEGLVETLPGKGPIVARLDWEQAQQIYDIRRLLEGDAARACALRADDAVKARLRSALEGLGTAYNGGDTGALIAASAEFYHRIFEAAGHDIAWDVVRRLNGRISRLRMMTLATEDRHVSGFARMKQIYQAIAANDPEAAQEAIRVHLAEAAAIAHRELEQDQ